MTPRCRNARTTLCTPSESAVCLRARSSRSVGGLSHQAASARLVTAGLIGALLAICAIISAPTTKADMAMGNYNLNIADRYDFHTWIWAIRRCTGSCVTVGALPQPIAKAFEYQGTAQLADGHYTFVVDVPDGLRCGDVYYGPIVATHDVYTWDATTLIGSLQSSFDAGCDGAPGSLTYPFTLTRM